MDGPGNMLMERIETAYDYMLSHPDSVCIASGGYENGYGITEAQCIRDALVEMGIESGRVYMEEKSTSTKTNIVQSTKLIKENGLPGDILIVTSGWHVYRCILLLKREGLDCGSLYAGTPLKELPSFYVRELYAILYCWFIEP